jgi:hypothetical protein
VGHSVIKLLWVIGSCIVSPLWKYSHATLHAQVIVWLSLGLGEILGSLFNPQLDQNTNAVLTFGHVDLRTMTKYKALILNL